VTAVKQRPSACLQQLQHVPIFDQPGLTTNSKQGTFFAQLALWTRPLNHSAFDRDVLTQHFAQLKIYQFGAKMQRSDFGLMLEAPITNHPNIDGHHPKNGGFPYSLSFSQGLNFIPGNITIKKSTNRKVPPSPLQLITFPDFPVLRFVKLANLIVYLL
jgi:hypothetical protein